MERSDVENIVNRVFEVLYTSLDDFDMEAIVNDVVHTGRLILKFGDYVTTEAG